MTDQVGNKLLGLMQAMSLQQSAKKTSGKTEGAESDFQKQLEKFQKDQSKPDNSTTDSKEPSTADKPETEPVEKPVAEENPVQAPKDETAETQQRMVLAAMATFQAPIVLMETPEPPAEVVETVAVAAVDETLITPEFAEESAVEDTTVLVQQEGPVVPVETEAPQKVEAQPQQEQQATVEVEPEQVEQKVQTAERPVQQEHVQTEARPVTERAETVEVLPQEKHEDVQVVDAEQAPQALFQDVKAAPIKVGEAMTTDQPEEAQDVGEQVTEPVLRALEKGDSRVEISLTPESLGNVRVEITRSQDGSLHVALSAETAQTRSLLEKHAGNLQNLLVDRNQGMVQVEVQRQQESQQNQNQNQNPNNNSYDGRNGHGQGQQQEHRRGQQHSESSEDFLQQLRLGLIPTDGE